MAKYLISEKTRNDIKNLIANNTVDLTEGRRRSRGGGFARPSSGSLSIICITGKTDDTTYTADLYGNGKDAKATESDITVKVLDIAEGETIPDDTWFFANQQTWGTGEEQETYYTIDIARWL